jgi:hypothetical protein
MLKVPVPKVPAAAYDPSRPASDLMKTQIQVLQAAILKAIDSEGEAALCIKVLTRLLREVRPVTTPTRYVRKRRVKGRAKRRRADERTTKKSHGPRTGR